MIVIVEGVDRVGKTTLCDMIEENYAETMRFMRFRDDTRYSHNYLDRAVNTEKINTLQNLMESGFVDNIILDRYHMTEFVYGACDRGYKNEDMFDIDQRLAELDRKDTVESEDEDDVDPGMSYTGKLQRDVVLIYVVPTDIYRSSAQHGKNLQRHVKWFDEFYRTTRITKKIKLDYTTRWEALDFIDDILSGRDWEEEPIPPGGSLAGDVEGFDYNMLKNRPQINGVVLEGNKKSKELGIVEPEDYTTIQGI